MSISLDSGAVRSAEMNSTVHGPFAVQFRLLLAQSYLS